MAAEVEPQQKIEAAPQITEPPGVLMMMVLQEIKSFREDIRQQRAELQRFRETQSQLCLSRGDRLALIEAETDIKSTPNRLKTLEDDVEDLKRGEYRRLGIAAGVGMVFGFVSSIFAFLCTPIIQWLSTIRGR